MVEEGRRLERGRELVPAVSTAYQWCVEVSTGSLGSVPGSWSVRDLEFVSLDQGLGFAELDPSLGVGVVPPI
ncbi:hypothetical protein U1Q18_036781 [Sarracenia purpurea var. burkii]